MTQLLQKAFERAAALPQEEQDRTARLLLEGLESEPRLFEHFDRPESEELLERLADEALAAHAKRKTLKDLYGVFADRKPSLSKSEERKVARRARASRYR